MTALLVDQVADQLLVGRQADPLLVGQGWVLLAAAGLHLCGADFHTLRQEYRPDRVC